MSSATLQEALQHIPAMLDSLAVCARFPQDSCNYALTAQDATEAVAAEEETATVLDKRQDLFTLFKNTAKLVSEPVYVFVGKQLQGVVSRQKAEWQVSILHEHNSSEWPSAYLTSFHSVQISWTICKQGTDGRLQENVPVFCLKSQARAGPPTLGLFTAVKLP